MDKENGEKVIFQDLTPQLSALRLILFLDERSYTMKKIIIVVSLVCLFVFTAVSAFSCTVFRLKANDGSIMVGRSMEFAVDLKYDAFVKQWGQVLKYQFLCFNWKKFRSKERA